ncbi:MAG TPA: RNA polymerase sigma factor [Saprospiraceae bacterium]|nr:RNA polymerase sigma factor [Saprospiraceae bacterium]
MFKRRVINIKIASDEELMTRVAKGNKEAFEELYDRYFGKLTAFAHIYFEDIQQAEDVVQEVFIKIIEKPEKFDSSKKFSTWVYVVTANLCKQSIRNAKNRLRIIANNKNQIGEEYSEQQNRLD